MYYCLLRDKHIYKKIIRIDFEHVYMLRQVYQGLCLFIILYFGISKVIPSITQGKRVGLVLQCNHNHIRYCVYEVCILKDYYNNWLA